jgi:hypothetical protein
VHPVATILRFGVLNTSGMEPEALSFCRVQTSVNGKERPVLIAYLNPVSSYVWQFSGNIQNMLETARS